MSTRIRKVMGLILTIMLIASIMIPAAPAAAAYGEQQFQTQPYPTQNSYVLAAGSDITDIAVGSGVIYVIDGATATGNIYKSTDGGTSWTKLTAPAAVALTKIAIAPDNANVIAVTNGAFVYSTNDAGSSWSNLTSGGLPATWTGAIITDVAVAPARSGTLLGREYLISVADPAAATTAKGDVLIIGGSNTWASALPAGFGSGAGLQDYVAVAVTPNFVGDRSAIALGAGAGGVTVQVINTASSQIQSTANLTTSTIDLGGAVANGIVTGSIALPTDFDATTTSGRRAYVGFSANVTLLNNDVYRVDDTSARALGAATNQGIFAVTYSGTISAGTLFAARKDTQEIKYSTDMTANSPTWTSSKKVLPISTTAGTLNTTNNVVVVASDFATSKKLYQGGTGGESGFAISADGGISFDQKSLIDCNFANTPTAATIGTITSGTTTVMASALNPSANTTTDISLWRSSGAPTDTSWSRIFVARGTSGSLSSMPNNTLLIADKGATTATSYLYRSTDNGATWNTRIPPAVPNSLVWQDENIGWLIDPSNNIYKTTNGGFIWGTAVQANVGTIKQAITGRTDELIVGGHGKIAISKDGGATFTSYDGADANDDYRLVKDSGYSTNNIIWVADGGNNTNKVYRWQVGTDPTPVDLLNSMPPGTISGISLANGVLYVGKSGLGSYDRALNPMDTPSQITWDVLNVGKPATFSFGTVSGANVFLRVSSPPALYVQADQMATAKPVVTAPTGNITIPVNPNNGLGQQFTLTLAATGSGQGLANNFDIDVAPVTSGWAGAARTLNVAGIGGVTTPTSPTLTSNTFFPPGGSWVAGTDYQLRIRASNQLSGEAAHSPWSDTIRVSVQQGGIVQAPQFGPQLLGPAGGATTSTTPGFAWAPIFGTTKYKFTLATDAALTKTVAGTPANTTLPSFQVTTALTEGQTYFWSVQAIEPSQGAVSVGTFTVAPKATAAPGTQPTITIPPITIPAPIITIPPAAAPTITIPPAPPAPAPITPAFIWAIIIIGAVLVIAVIVLIIRTRRVP